MFLQVDSRDPNMIINWWWNCHHQGEVSQHSSPVGKDLAPSQRLGPLPRTLFSPLPFTWATATL